MPKNFYKALAVLIGYIIGVGMFGVPYLVSKAGIFTFLVLITILGLVQHFLHMIYANVIVVTKDYHRLPGYASRYLGRNGKQLATVAKLIGNYGALLAYIIITGIFLNELLSPYLGGNEFIYASLLFAFQASVIYFGIGTMATVELGMTAVILVVVLLIIFKGRVYVDPTNFTLLNWKYLLLPYGAILFAVDGNGAIPVIVRLLRRNKKYITKVISIGTITSIIIIIAFTLVVVGISGEATSPDALTGIRGSIANSMVVFALIFGVFAMVTSFLGASESTREMLMWDYKLSKRWAWALALFVPYILYVAGLKSFIEVISFAGGVAGGTSAIILILIFRKLETMKGKLVIFKHKPKLWVTSLLIALFVGGIIYEVINFF